MKKISLSDLLLCLFLSAVISMVIAVGVVAIYSVAFSVGWSWGLFLWVGCPCFVGIGALMVSESIKESEKHRLDKEFLDHAID